MESIRKVKPPKLYIAADGFRPEKTGEAELCASARQVAIQVDWPCDVITRFRDTNLGPMHAQVDALDWFFSHEEAGIILEDDCLPGDEFFLFCEELLKKYKDDQRIYMISGNNFQDGIKRGNGDYYFSIYAETWGWATWSRAWQKRDMDLAGWPALKASGLIEGAHQLKATQKFWNSLFDRIYLKAYKRGWDFRWVYTLWKENGLAVIPNVNLVSNIGFGKGATNCLNQDSEFSCLPVGDISFPLQHPDFVQRNFHADEYLSAKYYIYNGLLKRIYNHAKNPSRAINKFLSILKGA